MIGADVNNLVVFPLENLYIVIRATTK